MKRFNLYKNGRYGMIHITSVATNNLTDAINFYKKNFGIKIGKELFQYKVTGLLKTITSCTSQSKSHPTPTSSPRMQK